jgi:methionyl-tRNA synthetase
MLHHMSSTEYLNYEGGKFSKAKGIGVFGTDAMETGIDADIWRFYIFYNRPEKSDALFTWKDFQEKVNGELIGNLGNLVNRTLSFVGRFYEGKIPAATGSAESAAFWEEARRYEADIAAFLERSDLRDAFRTIFSLCSLANKRFQDGEPWRTRKENPPQAESLIHDLTFLVRDIAVMIEPYMPAAAKKIASFFGLSFKDGGLSWESIGKDSGLDRVLYSEVLFTKLEDELINELKEKYSGSQAQRKEEQEKKEEAAASGKSAPESTKACFERVMDLRVAEIVKIERHPKADKLYIETLEMDGGDGNPEQRVIVSGLVPFYKEEELLGKRIIIAYNLKPAKLRGVESRGMLLAASKKDEEGGETVEVLDAGDALTGTRVTLEGGGELSPPAQIDIDAFFSVPLEVADYTVRADGRALTLGGKPVRTRIVDRGEVH